MLITKNRKKEYNYAGNKDIRKVNNKEFCVLHVQSNTTIFYLIVQ